MTKLHLKAFLSCSLHGVDADVVNYFRKMVEAFDVEPVVYDSQDLNRLDDAIKMNIGICDCLIAIVTRRDRIGNTDRYTCPPWIHDEVAIANALSKPIVIFVEDGAEIGGLMEKLRWERFNRADMAANSDKTARFLFELHKTLESTYERETLHAPALLRHYIHSRQQMLSPEETVERTEVLMESLVDGLEAAHHMIELEEATPGLSVKVRSLDFKCVEKPQHVDVAKNIIVDTEYKLLWNITFTPPLQKGEKVRYAYKACHPNYRPYTYEELLQRIHAGTYEYHEPKCEACEWTIVYPTYELRHEFEFPDGYEIEQCQPNVVRGLARMKAENEVKRIRDGGMFTAEKVFDKWVMRLQVPKPLLDHTYYTYYVPARSLVPA